MAITMVPLYKGLFGTSHFVLYRDVVFFKKIILPWNLTNQKSLGPDGVQNSEMFGLVKCIMVLMKHFVVSN